jgi:prepilin-type N-terminal cleavage/methylation domain-containing protein
MQIKISKLTGFTLVEIMIVVAIIGLLASIAIPNFVTSRKNAQATACINNIRVIQGAKDMWSLEAKKSSSDTATEAELQPYIGHGATGKLPTCPNDSASTFATSYSVNQVDAMVICNIGGGNAQYPHKLE